MGNFAISMVGNAIIGFLMAAFVLSVLKPRFNFALTAVITLFVVFYASLYGMLLLPANTPPLIKMSIGIVWDTCWGLFLFTDKRMKVVLSVSLVFMHEAICEVMAQLIFNVHYTSSAEVYSSPLNLLTWYAIYIIMFATLLFLSTLVINRSSDRLTWRELILFAIFPIAQVVMSMWILDPPDADSAYIARIGTILFCIASDVSLYLAVRGMSQRAELKLSNEMLSEQIESEKTHYAALVDQYETARSLRHDIANHMYTIQALLSSGDTEQAAKYAAEIIPRHTFSSTLGQCENRIVDAFMASRLEKLKDSGIRIETDIALPYESRIANADMIIALGNMLNNAEEACRAVKGAEPFIRIWAREENGCCTIRMENSAAAADTRKKARIHGLERGLGTGIINNIARQYNGTFITGAKGGVFSAALTMQVPAEAQSEPHTEGAEC